MDEMNDFHSVAVSDESELSLNHSPSLFSWMDLNTFRMFTWFSFPPKISRSSLLRLVRHDMEKRPKDLKKEKIPGSSFTIFLF